MTSVRHCQHCLRSYTGSACSTCDPAGACRHADVAWVLFTDTNQHAGTCRRCGSSVAWPGYGKSPSTTENA